MMKRSMRARMTVSLAASIALFIVLLSGIYLLYARHALERSFAASLDRMALESEKLAHGNASLAALQAQIEEHNAQVSQSGAISEGVEAWILDSHQKEIWRMGPPRPPHPDGDSHHGEHREDHESDLIPPLDKPEDWRIRTLQWGNGTLVLGLPWHRARHDLDVQAGALLILGVLISAAAACGAWLLVGKTLRPIDELTQQARDSALIPLQLMERRTLLQPTSTDIEMQNLVSTLNQMLDNVHEAALSKERFHTSASHELRTPLQSLAGHLSVTLARDRSPEEYKLALQEAASHTARLSKLTRDLLLLNRLQTAESLPIRELVDITEMCDIALQRAEKTIEARNLTVVTEWQPLEILATSSHVEILLGNLVENAAKYCVEGGKIGVRISHEGRSVQIWNDCNTDQEHSLEKELSRLFEPFYRPDAARSSDTGGNGLGLAIGHTIAQANGWTLELAVREHQFWVTVIFPDASAH